jgi:FKBP-type peptidyl-prolyl cis-trans isomerase 2
LKISSGTLVELSYVIESPDGEVLESSEQSGPLDYQHGQGELPPALEEALEGKQPGEDVTVSLGPGEAFGEYNVDGLVSVPRAEFPEDAELVVGDHISVTVEESESGEPEELSMRIAEVSPEAVVLDANHPLADQAVVFRVQVLGVAPAE